MKEIILDTETTGISVEEGHRIVEIGCIELDNLIPTKNKFHCYLNPQRKVSESALKVHGYTDEFLSDKNISDDRLPVPMLLAVGAVNTYLIKHKLRGYVSINVQSGEAMDTHSFATLIGVGATTVNPYLAFDSLFQRYSKKLFGLLSSSK